MCASRKTGFRVQEVQEPNDATVGFLLYTTFATSLYDLMHVIEVKIGTEVLLIFKPVYPSKEATKFVASPEMSHRE